MIDSISKLQFQIGLLSLIGDNHYLNFYDDSGYHFMYITSTNNLDKLDYTVDECFFLDSGIFQVDSTCNIDFSTDDHGFLLLEDFPKTTLGAKIKALFAV